MRVPLGGSIAVNCTTAGYYVGTVALEDWVRKLAEAHGVVAVDLVAVSRMACSGSYIGLYSSPFARYEVNAQMGSSVSWRKHGVVYGWKLCMLLAAWVPMEQLETPIPDPLEASKEDLKAYVFRVELKQQQIL